MTIDLTRDIETGPLGAAQLDEAAELFANRLDELAADVPGLPVHSAGEILGLLRRIAARGSGTAAIRDGHLIGYLCAVGVDGARGPGMAAYVPEWGWAVDPSAPDELLTRLYSTASEQWLARGWTRHLISCLAIEGRVERELAWLGFAPCVIDAVRDLSKAIEVTAPAGVTFERAGQVDIAGLAQLDRILEDHLRASPTFLHRDVAQPAARVSDWLGDADRILWVARFDGRPVSFVCLSRQADGAARVVCDPGVVHVVAACTHPEFRSRGIAEALLAMALQGGHGDGYVTAAVDFETANPLARRFWPRFFTPVCVSYERHLDPRIAAAEAVR
jgi:GNAT superfamily N-acetyltransferase